MKYKLVACDFDGTLYSDKHHIPERNIKAIHKYIDQGGEFLISTGRLYSALKKQLEIIGLKKGYAICEQGAYIRDIGTGEIKKRYDIPYKTSIPVLKSLDKNPDLISIMFYQDKSYTYEINEYIEYFSKLMNIPFVETKTDLSKYVNDKKINCTKFLLIVRPEKLNSVLNELQTNFGKELRYNLGADPIIEIVRKDVSKGNALKELAEHLGIKRERVMAIGDADNDISMIDYAGLGVAVKNASKGVKAACDVVVASNNDCGVAEAIEKYALGEK